MLVLQSQFSIRRVVFGSAAAAEDFAIGWQRT